MTSIGTNQSNLLQLTASDLDTVCAAIAAYGFTTVRFAASWAVCSTFFGSPALGALENVAAALEKHKLTPLPVLGINTPLFGTLAKFTTFVQSAVKIFGPIPAYEVWNEPNLFNFSVGSPASYLNYLRAAAPAIRGAGSKVMHAGLAAFPDARPFFFFTNYAPTTWLTALYAAGEKNDYDILGYHPYSLTAAGAWADPGTNPFGMSEIAAMNVIRAAHGDTRPYAFTEVGFDTGKTPAADAAGYLSYQINTLAPQGEVYDFCWRDNSGDGGSYGLVNSSNVPKASLYATVQGLL